MSATHKRRKTPGVYIFLNNLSPPHLEKDFPPEVLYNLSYKK